MKIKEGQLVTKGYLPKLKIKINELMVELSITKEKLVYYENKEKSNNEP